MTNLHVESGVLPRDLRILSLMLKYIQMEPGSDMVYLFVTFQSKRQETPYKSYHSLLYFL